jgi:hypothetical protein
MEGLRGRSAGDLESRTCVNRQGQERTLSRATAVDEQGVTAKAA